MLKEGVGVCILVLETFWATSWFTHWQACTQL